MAKAVGDRSQYNHTYTEVIEYWHVSLRVVFELEFGMLH